MTNYVTASSLGSVKESLEGYNSIFANPCFMSFITLLNHVMRRPKSSKIHPTCPPKFMLVHYTLQYESCKTSNYANSSGTCSHSVCTSGKNAGRRRSGTHNRVCGSRLETGESWG